MKITKLMTAADIGKVLGVSRDHVKDVVERIPDLEIFKVGTRGEWAFRPSIVAIIQPEVRKTSSNYELPKSKVIEASMAEWLT